MTIACPTSAAVAVREVTGPDLTGWDELVRQFPDHRVVHTRAWVESLAASGLGRPVYLAFERDGTIVGCLPGLVSSVAGWRLFGSPPPGSQSVSMGPVFDPERLSTTELLAALVPYLEQRHGIAHIELLKTGLDADAMRAAGFEGEPVLTHRAPLFPDDPPRALRAMKDSARRNIQRAQRLGLVVRFEDDPAFVDEHYEQLCEVYRRGGEAITFGKRRVIECFRHMQAAGQLIATSTYLPGGRVNIATGMFFVEGTELLLWTWAHRTHYRWYRPTELMTWMVMQRAMEAGCDTFDLMGKREFKTRLGAEVDASKWRWTRSRPRWLAQARRLAKATYRCQQIVRGQIAHLAGRVVPSLRTGGPDRREGPAAYVISDIDVVRALGLAGVPTVAVAPPGGPARYSRFTRGAVPWTDPWEQPAALVDTLVRHAEAEAEPPVLFYCDDRSLLAVSRHRDRLGEAFRFVIPDAPLVEALVDKGQFQALAARHRLPVPPGRPATPATEPAPTDLPFPLLVKPLWRRPERWEPVAGPCKAVRVGDPDALRALWDRLAAANIAVVLQAEVPGPESRIESYHVYVDGRGRVVAAFTGRKLRTYPATYGDTTALEITAAADVAKLGADIVRRIGLRGVAKLDFKRDPAGRLFLLEINPRFTLWHHAGALAGVNIPALVLGDLANRPRSDTPAARPGVRWCRPWTDYRVARASGVPLWQWLAWTLRCDAKRAVAVDDCMPLIRGALWRGLAPLRART